MNACLPSRCLLALGIGLSTTRAQNPPAHHPPGIQKMLDAPAWYLTYTIRVHANGANAAGHHALTRFTSGRMILGIRSGGPSLSVIANPSLMVITQPDQIDKLAANYANWLPGPVPEDENLPPNQRMTEAQAEAHFERVRKQNILAHQQFSYLFTGDKARTQMHGASTVWLIDEPTVEIDAANRKFRIKFAASFTDSDVNPEPVTGVREDNMGTIHHVRQAIKRGLYPTVEAITSMSPSVGTPAAPFFEGPLPGSGNISYSSVHAIQIFNGVQGTISFQFNLSPDPPAPIELIIKPPANYALWMPLGNKDEKTAGDSVPIEVVLQKIGGGTPQFKATRITYNLWKTSSEKGICMNWPPNPEPTPPFDLQFEQRENPSLLVVGTDGQSAVNSAPTPYTDTVTVSSFDFGAHGELSAMAELENGQVVHGVVQFNASQQQLRIPFRDEPSLIASQFFNLHRLSGVQDDDDAERDPVGDGYTGDGLTLYEEYRGFMVGDAWTPGDPKKKEVFVMNELRGLPSTVRGIRLFESVTAFKVHDRLRENQVNGAGQINFLRTAGPHLVDQHAIRIQPGELVLLGNQIAQVTGDVGTPGTAKTVSIPTDLGIQLGAAYMASTLAHEMLHACNVYHHGENDRTVWWSYSPPGTQFYESDAVWDPAQGTLIDGRNHAPITVRKEDGSVVLPTQFFPAGKTGGPIGMGMAHGQHSGHENCIMRYDVSMAYKSNRTAGLRYLSGRETTGFALCTSPAGTGVNDAGRTTPEPRYLTAATPQNGGSGVVARRGDCIHQLRVNDLATEPKR